MQGGSGELKVPTLRTIKLLLVVYVYDAEHDTFKQLPGMPPHMPLQIHNAAKALDFIDKGIQFHLDCLHLLVADLLPPVPSAVL